MLQAGAYWSPRGAETGSWMKAGNSHACFCRGFVAQWSRASVYETEGPGFDSRRSCAVFFSPDPAVSFLSSSEIDKNDVY